MMYPINPFNPYQGVNPTYLNQPNNVHVGNANQIIKVNGRGGAETYQMPPNGQVLLLDETQPIVWLKQTDGAGYPTLTAYDIKPHEEKPTPDYNALEERIRRIEEVINEQPNNSNHSKQNTENVTGKGNGSDNKVLQ